MASWRARSQRPSEQNPQYNHRATYQRGSAYNAHQEDSRDNYNDYGDYNTYESQQRHYRQGGQVRHYVNRHQYQNHRGNNQRNNHRYSRPRGDSVYPRHNERSDFNYNNNNRFNHRYSNNPRGRGQSRGGGYRFDESVPSNHARSKPAFNSHQNNVKLVKNTGKFQVESIPSHKLVWTLETIWNRYSTQNKHRQQVETLILLCGPPGCGKSTICKFAMKHYKLDTAKHDEHILDVSQMCSDVMKENQRVLISAKVYEKLFEQILWNKHQHAILIIDGFLRLPEHVNVTHFLKQQMQQTQFVFLVANIDEETSVKRQLQRGQKLLAESVQNDEEKMDQTEKAAKQRLKESDLNEDAARRRYVKYSRHLEEIRFRLKQEVKANFDVIDGTQEVNKVCKMVQQQLDKYEADLKRQPQEER